MPLVLESEGPRLDGVDGEVSELAGEEAASCGTCACSQQQPTRGPAGVTARCPQAVGG